MARTVTLLQLRNDARLYCDNRTSSPASAHITEAELTRLINLQLAELHDLFVSARGADYPATMSQDTLSLISGTAAYDLPDDFYQLAAIWIDRGDANIEQLQALPTEAGIPEAIRFTWDRRSRKFYRVNASQIEFFPTPNETVAVTFRYVPAFADLENDGDTYDGINGWEKLVTLGAAIEMRAIENTPPGALPELYAQQRDRIEAMAKDRQAIDPGMIRDVDRRAVWWGGVLWP